MIQPDVAGSATLDDVAEPREMTAMRRHFAAVAAALVLAAAFAACGGASPTSAPSPGAVAEVLIHVEVMAMTPSPSDDGTWQVTFRKNGEEVTAPTVGGPGIQFMAPGSKAVLRGTLTQAGDLTITSLAPDAG